jgi:hypothetical protein
MTGSLYRLDIVRREQGCTCRQIVTIPEAFQNLGNQPARDPPPSFEGCDVKRRGGFTHGLGGARQA